MKFRNILSELFEGSETYDFELKGIKDEGGGFAEAKYIFKTPKVDLYPNIDDIQAKYKYDSGTVYEVKMKPYQSYEEFTPWKDDYGEVPPIRVDFGPKYSPSEMTNQHRSIKIINTVVACIEDFIKRVEEVERLAIFAQENMWEGADSKVETKRGKIYRYIVRNSSWVEDYEIKKSRIDQEEYILVDLKR